MTFRLNFDIMLSYLKTLYSETASEETNMAKYRAPKADVTSKQVFGECKNLVMREETKPIPEYECAGIETIARGVCIQNGKVLLCKAKGGQTFYLPGGHIEFRETARRALIREMREEMGVDVTVGRFLGIVENAFLQHNAPHAEINLVYEMELPAGTPAVAQEDWIAFEWVSYLAIGRTATLLPPTMNAFIRTVAQGDAVVPVDLLDGDHCRL